MWHDGFTYVHNDSLPFARIKKSNKINYWHMVKMCSCDHLSFFGIKYFLIKHINGTCSSIFEKLHKISY
jgi:hypothetical protein